MTSLKLILALVLAVSSVQAFADHESLNGPCKQYWDTCQSNGTAKGRAMGKCVMEAAKTANDQACLAAMKKHKMHGSGGNSSGAAPSTPATTQ